jgi:TolB-like protein/DNA-binding winged helix-turn-helix (wHTH) protein/Tfp pilus assembly protein PilF
MSENRHERWLVADLIVDVSGQSVTRGDQAITLPQLSFKFLLALIHAAPAVLSIDELMELVWKGIFVNSETVTQRAKLLRDALGDDPKEPRYLTARRGVGYQLVPMPVRQDRPPAEIRARIAPPRWKAHLAAAALGIAAIAGATAMFARHDDTQSAVAPIRVAVLPFDNLSSDPADAFIARSIPEMVLNRLSSIRGLTVIARDSALLSPAAQATPKDTAARLNAAYVVRGSVQRLGMVLRVTCFVVDTERDRRLWSERFDWPVDRLYALQDRIADRVASSLEANTHEFGELAPAAGGTRNTDAYLAYLKGKSLLGRFTVAETDAAAGQFERAVRLDPQFAPALVALYDARMQAADLRKDDLGPIRARYAPLLDQALRQEPNSGEALFAKAMWSGAPADQRQALFRRAAELDPSNARGLTAYAEFLEWANTTREGPAQNSGQLLMERVLSIDPLSPRAHFWAVQRQLGTLTPAQLEEKQRRALELDPQNYLLANRYALRRWMFHAEFADAVERMERVIAVDPQNPWGPHLATAFYLDLGDRAAAGALAETTPASRDSTRAVLAQFDGDWRTAGTAALGPRGFLFNQYENWLWSESVRDYALQTREFDRAAEAIATRYGFDLDDPTVTNLQQTTAAVALGHILLASGKTAQGKLFLGRTIRWIDQHPRLGLVGVGRIKAGALMLLGQRDAALSLLTATVRSGPDRRLWWYLVGHDPVWAPVRGDPRFRAIEALCRRAATEQRAKLEAMRRAGKAPVRASPRPR